MQTFSYSCYYVRKSLCRCWLSLDNPSLYRYLAGTLQFLTFTHVDISYVVQQVCLFMHALRVEHMAALHRIHQYIQGTHDHGLQLYKSPISSLLSYTNADLGGCPDTCRSTSC